MGTVVHAGSGRGVVVATGAADRVRQDRRRAGRAPARHRVPDRAAPVLDAAGLRRRRADHAIFVINVVLHRPVIDALLFSLAIAVGITPQLLPAVVSHQPGRRLPADGRRKVLVKRLVCIEDLGDVDVLFTDKTGTLTEGRIGFMRALPDRRRRSRRRAAAGDCSAPRAAPAAGGRG